METKNYVVELTLLEPLLGTVPKDKDIYATYIATKKESASIGEVDTVPENNLEEKGWTGFHTDDTGIFLYDYQIKGFLKEAGNVLKAELKVKNLRSKLDDYVFVFPRRIQLAEKPDGVIERPLRAMTAQGPRVTLARSDTVNAGRVIRFEVRTLAHSEITEALLVALLDYGALKGLGQFRNGSYGRVSYTLSRM